MGSLLGGASGPAPLITLSILFKYCVWRTVTALASICRFPAFIRFKRTCCAVAAT